jgi:RNA-directed DNA polymerase
VPDGAQPSGRSGKALCRTPDCDAGEKSDACIVPSNDPNNGGGSTLAPTEDREGRRATKRNAKQSPAPRTQSRTGASMGLDGVREVACKSKEGRFTALMHHITPDLLIESFMQLKHAAAPGVDGMTWRAYEEGLERRMLN